MATGRESIEDGLTGQRFIFRLSAAETGGDAVVFESFLPAAARGLATGAEAEQEQRFEVLHGSLRFRVGGEDRLLEAGGRLTVPRGTACWYWNASDEPAHLVAEIRPALDFEERTRAHCQGNKRSIVKEAIG